jgi:hypothetical protein
MKRMTFRPNNLLGEGLLERNEQPLGQRFFKTKVKPCMGFTLPLEPCLVEHGGPQYWDIFFQQERQEERERAGANGHASPPPSPLGSIYRGWR